MCKRIELKRCIITESRWKRNWRSLISPEAVPMLLLLLLGTVSIIVLISISERWTVLRQDSANLRTSSVVRYDLRCGEMDIRLALIRFSVTRKQRNGTGLARYAVVQSLYVIQRDLTWWRIHLSALIHKPPAGVQYLPGLFPPNISPGH